jgi:hypothetical protein
MKLYIRASNLFLGGKMPKKIVKAIKCTLTKICKALFYFNLKSFSAHYIIKNSSERKKIGKNRNKIPLQLPLSQLFFQK